MTAKRTRNTPPRAALEDRFLAQLVLGDSDGHWLWAGAQNGVGYGQLYPGPKVGGGKLAHRIAYQLFVGPIPQGLTIHHRCYVRHCVNPAHLEAITLGENIRDAHARNGTGQAKDRCIRDHPYTEANTYRSPGKPSKRRCRTCARDLKRAAA